MKKITFLNLLFLVLVCWNSFAQVSENDTCGGVYLDSGGIDGNYGSNEETTTTIMPDTDGEVVTVTFTYVDIESSGNDGTQDGCWDFLTVYDGPDTSSPVLAATLCGEESGDGGVPSVAESNLPIGTSFTSSHSSGALTFVFTSDSFVQETGWEADITCGPPPACPAVVNITITPTAFDALISWDEVVEATNGYIVNVFNTGDDPMSDTPVYTEMIATGTLMTTATGLLSEATYDAYVIADCDTGGLSMANANTFTTELSCIQPSNLQATDINLTEVIFTWDEVAEATNGYIVNVFNEDDDPTVATPVYTEMVATGVLTSTASGLSQDTIYDAYVISDCGDVNGMSLASMITVTTLFEVDETCGGTYIDSGGLSSNYSANEETITTIMPDTDGEIVTVTFTYVDIETSGFSPGAQDGCWDFLTVYDGPDTSSPVLAATLCGEESGDGGVPSVAESNLPIGTSFTSSHPSGALTFVFTSDGFTQETGWEADITCELPPLEECSYTLEMNDSFGDGWNGAIMDVLVDGVVVLDDVSLDDDPNSNGIQGSLNFPVSSGADVTTVFVDGGVFPGEVSYRIIDLNEFEVGSGTADPTTDIPSGTIIADCPSCLVPQNLVADNFMLEMVDISWDPLGIDALGYIWEIQDQGVAQGTPGAIATGSIIGMTADTAIGAFIDSNSYTLYVQSFCDEDDSSVFVSIDFQFLLPPENDEAITATPLTVGMVFTDFAVIGSNVGATDSVDSVPSCAFYNGSDVWYTLEVPATGNVTVETSIDDGSILDGGLSIYEGDLGSLIEVECNDDGGNGFFSLVSLTGRTPGEILYARVWEFGGNVEGTFQISAYDNTPDCVAPVELDVINITQTSVDLTWEDGNNVVNPTVSYTVEWGVTGFTLGEGTVVADITDTMLSLTDLNAATSYDFYVSTSCSNDFESDVSGPFNFTTLFEQAPSGECEYTLEMFDTFGDGWNGALISVFRNGQIVLDSVSLDDDPTNSGDFGSLAFEIIPGDDITTIFVNPGDFPGEIIYRIVDINGVGVATGDPFTNITSGTITGDCTVLGLEDNSFEGFTFFPNPVSEVLNLDSRVAIENIVVFNLLGQKVLEQEIGVASYQLNTSNLAKGSYIMQVTIDGETSPYKIIKR